MHTKLLKQIHTGHIYVWTENLASRDDMEPYERPQVTENTSENPVEASAEQSPDTDLQGAVEAFRRQVTKAGRKPTKKSSGET